MSAAQGDWPQFRGPTGQGIARLTNPPVAWNSDDGFTWKRSIPGHGWSSPIVHEGQIVLTTAVPDSDSSEFQSLRAMGLDAATGEIVWDREIFRVAVSPKHDKNSFASPTPITDGKTVYVHFGPEGTAALDLAGNPIWTNEDIEYDARHGGGGSPILLGDLLVFNCDGVSDPFVIALDRKTGKERWRTYRHQMEYERFSFSTPLAIEVDGRTQIVSIGSNYACSYAPEDGNEIWRVGFSRRWSVVPRPVFSAGLVLFTTGYEGPASLMAVRPDGTGDVTETHVAWTYEQSVPHTPSPVVVDDRVYLISDEGIATCLDIQTGDLHWRKRLGGAYSASPIAAGGNIYCPNEEGECVIFRASERYEEVARNDLEARTFASFATAEGALFIRTESHLYRID
ncbi:MAG: PQQ-binding-like beta-propeller repeat protein [Planctomycetota bacterium]